jgi:PilZ domain
MAANLSGRLESADAPISSDKVMITNISSHGARVISHRHWQPHDRATLIELTGDFHLAAEVIYCRRQRDDTYVVGLKFRVDGRA